METGDTVTMERRETATVTLETRETGRCNPGDKGDGTRLLWRRDPVTMAMGQCYSGDKEDGTM